MMAESDKDDDMEDREPAEHDDDDDEDIYKPIQELDSWQGFKESQAEDDQRIRNFQKTMSITRKVNKFVTRQSTKFNRANKAVNGTGDDYGQDNGGTGDIAETDNESLMGSQVEGSVLDVLDDDFKTDLLKLREMKYPVFTDNQIEAIKQGVKEELDGLDQPELDFEEKYYSQQQERLSQIADAEHRATQGNSKIHSVTPVEGNHY
jgi:hypothetical protein